MKPVNQEERKKAFLNFLFLFIITVAAIIAVVYFSIEVPFAENKKMKAQLKTYQNEQSFAVQFSAQMTDPQVLLSRLGSSRNDSVGILNSQISAMLTKLATFKNTDSSASGNDNIYAKSLSSLYALQTAYSSLANYANQSQNQGELFQENQNLKQRLSDANNYILQLTRSIPMPTPPPF
jgi:hypothetical protein